MRTLRRLRIPVLIFVNKIDRGGARYEEVLRGIAEKLTTALIPMGTVRELGTRDARYLPHPTDDRDFTALLLDRLVWQDDGLLSAYLDDGTAPSPDRLRNALARQTQHALVHPVFFGSAVTGAGVDELITGIRELLPGTREPLDGPVCGTVFKVERGPAGEKIAYVRMFSGTVRVRDRLPYGAADEGGERHTGKVTAISVFGHGTAVPEPAVGAGRIGKVGGLGEIRIGDVIGVPTRKTTDEHYFSPPSLETVVVPEMPGEKGALHLALTQLAEQDPLIGLRQDDFRQEVSVSLYGEVQKEVIEATLAEEYGIGVTFRETTPLCVERPVGSGEAVELNGKEPNPFLATIGLRIDPAPTGAGVEFRLEVELGSMPYAFFKATEDTIREALTQGVHGWRVTDCTVTMTHSGYSPRQSHAHQGFDKSMSSTGADFRGLAPLVLMAALRRAGTRVYEPMHRFRLDIPADTLGSVLPVLGRLRAGVRTPEPRADSYVLRGELPAARVHELGLRLPGLTRGEGVWESAFACFRPVPGGTPPPNRPRTDHNPLDREEYLLRVMRRV